MSVALTVRAPVGFHVFHILDSSAFKHCELEPGLDRQFQVRGGRPGKPSPNRLGYVSCLP